MADELGIEFINTADFVKVGLTDSLHLEEKQQHILAEVVARKVQSMI